MKILITIISICLIGCNTLKAQNQFDEDGLRTGLWIGYYPDSTIRYEANFHQGNPTGVMKRYDNKGNLVIDLNYAYPNPNRCFAKMYSPDGKIKAQGVYENREKDSVWIYLGPNDEIRMSESYKQGVPDGPKRYFYHLGTESQTINFVNGIKNGDWYKFFKNGDTMMIANYANGELSGTYTTFYPEGNIQISGQYKNDLKDGSWNYFSEEGDTLLILKYKMGNILNPESRQNSYEQFIEEIEKNVGNMPDPAEEFR